MFATLNETVNALMGDVPEGSLERLGQPSRCLTVVWKCVDEQAEPSTMSGTPYMTRRSEASLKVDMLQVEVVSFRHRTSCTRKRLGAIHSNSSNPRVVAPSNHATSVKVRSGSQQDANSQ